MKKDWVECILDDVLIRMSNGSSAKQFNEKVGFPISRIETIWNETIDLNRVKYIKESSEEIIEKYGLLKNDILFSHINSNSHLGKTAIYKNQTKVLIHGINLLLLRPSSLINAGFLLFQLRYIKIQGLFIKVAQQAVNQSSINQRKLKAFALNLPPLPIQRAIVSKIEELFSDLDNGIGNLKKAQEQLKVYRQAVLKKAFEGIGKVSFDKIIEASQNGLSKRKGDIGEAVKVLRLSDITNLKIDNSSPRTIVLEKHEIKKYKLNKGDLIIIRVNGSIDLVGRFIHVCKKNELELWAFCDHFIRVTMNADKYLPKFYFYYFQVVKARRFIHQNMVSSAGQNTVSQKTIKSVPVPLTSIKKQHQIVQEIESRLSVCDKVEESIEESLAKAEALRQSILKKAFEGKLLSKEEIELCKAEADYEPAHVLLERIKEEKKQNKNR